MAVIITPRSLRQGPQALKWLINALSTNLSAGDARGTKPSLPKGLLHSHSFENRVVAAHLDFALQPKISLCEELRMFALGALPSTEQH